MCITLSVETEKNKGLLGNFKDEFLLKCLLSSPLATDPEGDSCFSIYQKFNRSNMRVGDENARGSCGFENLFPVFIDRVFSKWPKKNETSFEVLQVSVEFLNFVLLSTAKQS